MQPLSLQHRDISRFPCTRTQADGVGWPLRLRWPGPHREAWRQGCQGFTGAERDPSQAEKPRVRFRKISHTHGWRSIAVGTEAPAAVPANDLPAGTPSH